MAKRTEHFVRIETPLIEGQQTQGISFGVTPIGRLSYVTPWSGIYGGVRVLDGATVHYFEDGRIGDIPQSCHAIRTSNCV